MSHIRSSLILLGICVVALLIGALRLATERTPLPVGSSYSTEPLGAQALYEWTGAVGGTPSRLQEAVVDDADPPASVLVLQPETVIDPAARQAFDTVPERGGTLVVAGDSLAWTLYARQLGITVEPIRGGTTSVSTADGQLDLNVQARYRVEADDASPVLEDGQGNWIALRRPYRNGSLIVIATPEPLLNRSLGDDQVARFVYRELLTNASTIAFDEAHHSFMPPNTPGAPVTVEQLVLNTPAGRALLYAAAVVFVFLLLTGRRLGPPLVGHGPTETRRTMYEHVQMLANLYRRAGQFGVVRAAFARHYQREAARLGSRGDALVRIELARNDAELIAAVSAAQGQA
jgi:hypothetical protein